MGQNFRNEDPDVPQWVRNTTGIYGEQERTHSSYNLISYHVWYILFVRRKSLGPAHT